MKHLFRQTATIRTKSGVDRYGKPSWNSPITVRCRFVRTTKRIIDEKGEEVNADAQLVTFNDDGNLDSLATGDRITFDSTEYRIVGLYEGRSDLGAEVYKTLMLKVWQG